MPHHLQSDLENSLSMLQCILVARRNRYNPEGISWVQYDILESLRLSGPLTPSVLSTNLGLSRSSLSKALRMLKDLELINQSPLANDRREQTTGLTESGYNFLQRAATSRHETAALVSTVLTPGEQAIFAELCQKACSALTPDLPCQNKP